ncbi:Nuclear transcription factor Y subunit B-7 [Hibiscus syriacus]|uniref:Methyltransferase n=1 Tax=Hibiscus syriacus TaxID=106335 RepID=A0A6A3A6Q6_HIBSY|nr:Nuclear transcription factor Y subunit B-7 [Hibiscus syriacus]
MALGKYSRVDNRSSSSGSYCSTVPIVLFMGLCLVGIWMITSSWVVPIQNGDYTPEEKKNHVKDQFALVIMDNNSGNKPQFEDKLDDQGKDAPQRDSNVSLAKDDGKTNFNAKENNKNTEETKLEKSKKDNEQSNTLSEKSKKDNEQSNPEGGVRNNDSGENLGGQRSENSNEKPFSNENDKNSNSDDAEKKRNESSSWTKGNKVDKNTDKVLHKRSDGQVKKNSSDEVFPSGAQSQSSDGQVQMKSSQMKFFHLSVPDIAWGKRSRVLLDVGCGVASFGGYLFERNVLSMSLAPKDEHEAQSALERGIPAVSAVMGTKRLPYPSSAFDQYAYGKLLLKFNRLLRPGGFFVRSANPVYRRKGKNVEIRSQQEPPLYPESDDPNATCGLRDGQKGWKNHLIGSRVPKSEFTANQHQTADSEYWKNRVTRSYINCMGIDWLYVQNVMDMRTIYGGFAAALKDKNFWVMNVVPINSPDTLPIIFERGFGCRGRSNTKAGREAHCLGQCLDDERAGGYVPVHALGSQEEILQG